MSMGSPDTQERVRLRLKVGEVDVEVECSVEEVGGVVERVLGALAQNRAAGGVAEKRGLGGLVGGRGETCKSVILSLWSEGWFGIGRSLGEVHAEMGRQGFHYDRTAVAHALVDLVRDGVLTRVGRPRRYNYLQKRPPPSVKPSKD
jgi:hypothetical protein